MALTKAQLREKLSELGMPTEQIEDAVKWIMDGHITSLNALREERDKYKTDAEKLPDVQKELDDLKAKGDQNWQQQYENEHAGFEAYKAKVEGEKVKAHKTGLYRALLKECKVGEKQIEKIIKVSGDVIDGLTIKDDKIEDAENVKANILKDWSDFVMTEQKKGAAVDEPPANNGGNGKPAESRAAKIAAEYHKNLYGETKGD